MGTASTTHGAALLRSDNTKITEGKLKGEPSGGMDVPNKLRNNSLSLGKTGLRPTD